MTTTARGGCIVPPGSSPERPYLATSGAEEQKQNDVMVILTDFQELVDLTLDM